jgi:hypothetical protein
LRGPEALFSKPTQEDAEGLAYRAPDL